MDRLKGYRLKGLRPKAGVRNSKHFSLQSKPLHPFSLLSSAFSLNPFSLNIFIEYTSTVLLLHGFLRDFEAGYPKALFSHVNSKFMGFSIARVVWAFLLLMVPSGDAYPNRDVSRSDHPHLLTMHKYASFIRAMACIEIRSASTMRKAIRHSPLMTHVTLSGFTTVPLSLSQPIPSISPQQPTWPVDHETSRRSTQLHRLIRSPHNNPEDSTVCRTSPRESVREASPSLLPRTVRTQGHRLCIIATPGEGTLNWSASDSATWLTLSSA